MAKYKTQAICIRKIDYSDTSQVLWFFTPDGGHLTLIAKGSKRSTKTKPSTPVDTASFYELIYHQRKDSDMGTLVEYHMIDNFPGIHHKLNCYFAALYVLEICNKTLLPHTESEQYFYACLQTLNAISQSSEPQLALYYFQIQTLDYLGSSPEFRGCVNCGARLKRERRPEILTLSINGGGLVCQYCRGADETFTASRKSISAYEAIVNWGLPSSTEARQTDFSSIQDLIQPLFHKHFDKPLKSRRYCF